MALICTRSVLMSLPSSISRSTSLASDLWWRLSSLGISRSKSTLRECRAGLSHHRRVATQQVWITLQAVFWLQIFVEGKIYKMKLFCFCSLFLIKKDDTSCACNVNKRSIPVVLSRNRPRASNASGRNSSKFVTDWNRGHDHKKLNEYGFSLLLANSMSLAPKIDEVKCAISDVNPDLAFFTETWLRDSIIENYPHIPGYHFTARNRTSDHHGGVGLYTKNSIKFKSLDYLQDPDFETTWTWLQQTAWNHLSDCWHCIPLPNCQRHG